MPPKVPVPALGQDLPVLSVGEPRWMSRPRLVSDGSAADDPRAYSGNYLLHADRAPEELQLHPAFRGAQFLKQRPLGAGWLLQIKPPAGREPTQWKSEIAGVPGVRTLTREARRWTLQAVPNDPFFARQWSHRATSSNTASAWGSVSVDAQASVVVAVLDTGLDTTHPEFSGRVVAPFDATTNGVDVTDTEGHGTHVAGIVAAQGDNGVGIAGVAWGCRIKPVKVFADDLGAGSDFDIINGFLNAVNWVPSPDDGSRVRVINMSLGADTSAVDSIWVELAQMARNQGIVVVAASGNGALPFVGSPANTPGILAVGSSNYHVGWEGISAFSNGGSALDLVAPGEAIISTVPGGGYASQSGTSMATPYVAGVAALLMARYDPLNQALNSNFVEAVERRLRLAVDDLDAPGPDPLAGQGRLNAGRALAPATLAEDP
jgi:thermitase